MTSTDSASRGPSAVAGLLVKKITHKRKGQSQYRAYISVGYNADDVRSKDTRQCRQSVCNSHQRPYEQVYIENTQTGYVQGPANSVIHL